MKKYLTLTSIFLLIAFANIAHAEQCFPKGSISVHVNSTGQTLQAEVSPMGAITIHDPQYGTLNGYIDNLGYFNASNDSETVHGSVDTTCAKTQDFSGNIRGCLAPVTQDCDANALGGTTVQQNLYGMGNSSIGQGAIQACKDKHTRYQTELNTYNACLNTKTQSQSWTPPALNLPTPTVPTKASASCQEQHGIHSVTEGDYCTCPLVGYDFDSSGQCIASGTVDDRKKILNPSLITPDILKTVAKIFQSYYPDTITTLNKSVQGYSTGDQGVTSSLSAIEKILQIESNNSDDLNNTYRDKSISSEAINAINSLKHSSIVCLATAQVMLKNDGLNIVQSGLKKCTGWSDSLNKLLSASNSLPVQAVTATNPPIIPTITKVVTKKNLASPKIFTDTSKQNTTTNSSTSSDTVQIIPNSTETSLNDLTAPVKVEVSKTTIHKHWYEWLNPFSWFK
jgi:hypothetical protein